MISRLVSCRFPTSSRICRSRSLILRRRSSSELMIHLVTCIYALAFIGCGGRLQGGPRTDTITAMELYNDLLPDPLPAEPMALASAWLATARAARQQPNPDAMVLATTGASGQPSARIVLCKEFD